MKFEQGDIVLCNVDKILGTTVFVNIEGTQKRGAIILSEVAAGRIRNLRNYVVPKKTIICKVLRILQDHIELSLRRVTQKERKEILEENKIEKNQKGILKSILKEKSEEIINQIKEKGKIYDFLQKSREDSSELKLLVGKENAKKILEILNSQKEKKVSLKKIINLTSTSPNGLTLIKKTLENIKNSKIKYLAAGRYSIKTEDKEIKSADKKLNEILKKIEEKALNEKIEFSIK